MGRIRPGQQLHKGRKWHSREQGKGRTERRKGTPHGSLSFFSYNALVVVNLILYVLSSDAMLPPTPYRRVRQVDIAVVAIKLWHVSAD
jgi:hypothetical protein